MKWWQKKSRGWIVPFWCTEIPLFSYRFFKMRPEETKKMAEEIRKQRQCK